MRKALVGCVSFSVVMALAFGISRAGLEGKPKHTIKDVMKEAHKEKLVNKVMEGNASKEEKEKLLALYVSLHDNKPPKGEADSWSQKTSAIVVASAKALVGAEGAADALKTATNCGACHKAHKPN